MKSYKFHILSLATLLLLGATTHVEAKIFERKKKKAQTEVKAAPVKQNINGLKPYAQVITPKAKSSFGFLTVHKVDNNYFFEIPDSMLNRDILIVNRISKAPTSRQKSRVGYPGDILGSKVIRFENKDNKRILVREYSYRERSENKGRNVPVCTQFKYTAYRSQLRNRNNKERFTYQKLCNQCKCFPAKRKSFILFRC